MASRQVRAALVKQLPAVRVLAEDEAADDAGLDVFAIVSGEEAVRAA